MFFIQMRFKKKKKKTLGLFLNGLYAAVYLDEKDEIINLMAFTHTVCSHCLPVNELESKFQRLNRVFLQSMDSNFCCTVNLLN